MEALEVYISCVYELFFDVNCLYFYVALHNMPGLVCSKILYLDDRLNVLFGFFVIEAALNI